MPPSLHHEIPVDLMRGKSPKPVIWRRNLSDLGMGSKRAPKVFLDVPIHSAMRALEASQPTKGISGISKAQ